MNCYCINLDRRPERWAQTHEEMKIIEMYPIRFSATIKRRRHSGCIASHMALWKQVRDEGIVMIIEDDILFLDNAKENFEAALSQLPSDWDMLYLGATLNQPLERISDNLLLLKKGWTCHAIVYNNQNGVLDYIIKEMIDFKIDVFMADVIQEKFNCYMCYPMVATQRPGLSDITRKYTDYNRIMSRYKKYVEKQLP